MQHAIDVHDRGTTERELDAIRATPLAELTTEQVRPLAEQITALRRRRGAGSVSKFNSGL